MKNYILAAIGTMSFLSTLVQASECVYKEVPSTGKTYVTPIYKANVNFVFDKKDQSGFAQTSWSLDHLATKKCFKEGQEKFPTSKVVIPTVRVGDLVVNVLNGASSKPLHVLPEANGHWNGMSDLIKIPYSSREEIELAIKNKESVITISGDMGYRLTEIERKVVGKVECTEKNEEAGVLNLFKRFGEIRNLLEKRNQNEGVVVEEVMQEFMGACVVFQNVDSNSLTEFDSAQRLNSRIVIGNLYLKGNALKETTHSMPTIAVQTASILDI